jgi:hypothetical protein
VYTDQTGRFPVPSSTGNNYLVIAYDYNSNSILLWPIKDRLTESLIAAIQDIHNTLRKGGCQPQFHRMDNKCSQAIKEYFNHNNITYQLAPPGEHRTNAAEWAIRTAKNHLKAGWWSMDKRFPMHLWDLTVPQAASEALGTTPNFRPTNKSTGDMTSMPLPWHHPESGS